MTGVGIHDGDLLVVDRSRTPRDGDQVIAVLDGELTCKTYRTSGGRTRLVAERPEGPAFAAGPGHELEVWGVVTAVIHELSRHG